jgi:hypothetical protein
MVEGVLQGRQALFLLACQQLGQLSQALSVGCAVLPNSSLVKVGRLHAMLRALAAVVHSSMVAKGLLQRALSAPPH